MKLKSLTDSYLSFIDKDVKVSGWVLTKRVQKDLSFVKINDGSNSEGVQLVFNE